jgi:hypothetical protein
VPSPAVFGAAGKRNPSPAWTNLTNEQGTALWSGFGVKLTNEIVGRFYKLADERTVTLAALLELALDALERAGPGGPSSGAELVVEHGNRVQRRVSRITVLH